MSNNDKENLVREHISWMLGLARRITGDWSTAEDVVQESFINAFRAFDSLEDPSKLKSWLHRITVNAALAQLRRENRLSEQPIDEYLPEFDHNDCRIENRWNYLARLEDVMENLHLQTLVTKSLSELPDAYRVIVQLRDIEGYSTGEVAELLDLTPNNVKIRLHRARSAMKKLLEPLLRGEVS